LVETPNFHGDFDLIFAYTASGDMYEIPFELLEGQSGITVGNKYGEYKLN
jgi:hypothetical protein